MSKCQKTRDCLEWRAAAYIARKARIEWEMSRKKTKPSDEAEGGKGEA